MVVEQINEDQSSSSEERKNIQQETVFDSAIAEVKLQRYPRSKSKSQQLRAWDAADEYVLQHVKENNLLTEGCSILVINDLFGGLSLPLQEYKPVVMTDSFITREAINANCKDNQVSAENIILVNSLDDLQQAIVEQTVVEQKSADQKSTGQKSFDLVLIKVPKSLAMLEDQLYRIRSVLDENSTVIAAGMTKNIHTSTMALFEQIIGVTSSSRAQKKSRLIFASYDADLNVAENPYPKSYDLPYKLDDKDISVSNHAAVFSQAKLDIGTRFLIENIPADERYETIVDLGCGNGAVGLLAAIKNPQAKLIFTDESFMAVDSAINNFVSIFEESREAEFLQTDCLAGVEQNSVSLILCNPPFHQNNTITDEIAWQMFTESKEALAAKGELWVIGNRHLSYSAKLKHLFGDCEVVASNKKFSIIKAVKS